jgi:hypothetical protein
MDESRRGRGPHHLLHGHICFGARRIQPIDGIISLLVVAAVLICGYLVS